MDPSQLAANYFSYCSTSTDPYDAPFLEPFPSERSMLSRRNSGATAETLFGQGGPTTPLEEAYCERLYPTSFELRALPEEAAEES